MVGVLGIQGSVEEHLAMLEKCGEKAMTVKSAEDLEKVFGLIIPGGESTVIGKLLKKTGLQKVIQKRMRGEKPFYIWGTCAGAILLAKKILNIKPEALNLMNIRIIRNAYGRQMDSFETKLDIPILGKKPFPGIFIRAPKMEIRNGFFDRIGSVSPRLVEILASYGGKPVMAKEGNLLVTMFHPELTDDLRIHKYFISLISPTPPTAPSYARTHRTIHQRTHQTIAGKRQTRRVIQNAQKGRARV